MRLKLHLAECPTDVLVWLVDTQPAGGTRDAIAAGATPSDAGLEAGEATRLVARALRLLYELHYVSTRGNERTMTWHATADGIAAVRAAENDVSTTPGVMPGADDKGETA